MENWKIRDIVAVVVATVEAMAVEFLDLPIHRIAVIGICGLSAVLVILLWPEEIEEEIWVSPQDQEMERLGGKFQEMVNPLAGSMEKMGYIRRKVKRKKWPLSNDGSVRRWNSETCEWEWDYE